MATRLYYDLTVEPPPITLEKAAEWESPATMLLTRLGTLVQPPNSDPMNTLANDLIGLSGADICWGQFICKEPLDAQTISGTVKGVMLMWEWSASNNAQAACCIRVVGPDGTVRGTLLNGFPPALTDEVSAVDLYSRYLPAESALTPVAAQAGDYLVVEIGFRQFSTMGAGNEVDFTIGCNGPADLEYNETQDPTAMWNNPWIEFSLDIAFGGEGGGEVVVTDSRLLMGPLYYPKFKAWHPTTKDFLSGGKLFTMEPEGTWPDNPKITYTDRLLTTPNTNPIILNSVGEPAAEIYLDGPTKLRLEDAEGNEIWTLDSIAILDNVYNYIMGLGFSEVDKVQTSFYWLGTSTNGTDDYMVELTPAPDAYSSGLFILLVPDVTNNSAATLNVKSAAGTWLGAKLIKKQTTAGLQSLSSAEIVAGVPVFLFYSLSNNCWVLANYHENAVIKTIKSSGYSITSADHFKDIDCYGTFTVNLPACSTLWNGFVVFVRNSGTGTIGITASGADLIIAPGGTAGGDTTIYLPGSPITDCYSVLLQCDGSNWVVLLHSVTRGRKEFTASGSWVCPAGVTRAWISGVGGGGGGGGGGNTAPTYRGGGGGGGEVIIRKPVTVVPGTTYTATVGAEGAKGIGGNPAGTDGGNGGDTVLTGLFQARGGGKGGGGGVGALTGTAGASGGWLAVAGANGDPGGGGGGGNFYSAAAPKYGQGGDGGAPSGGGGAGADGVAGAAGYLLIEW